MSSNSRKKGREVGGRDRGGGRGREDIKQEGSLTIQVGKKERCNIEENEKEEEEIWGKGERNWQHVSRHRREILAEERGEIIKEEGEREWGHL